MIGPTFIAILHPSPNEPSGSSISGRRTPQKSGYSGSLKLWDRPPEIFGSRVPAEFGKTRGIYIDGTEEHDGYWTSLQRCLHRNGIDAFPFLPGSGPNDWPRGKVAFNAGLNRFEVGMSQHLVEPQFMGEILEYFHLPKTSTRFSADPRYANVRFRLSC
jgi:hypothetical protein